MPFCAILLAILAPMSCAWIERKKRNWGRHRKFQIVKRDRGKLIRCRLRGHNINYIALTGALGAIGRKGAPTTPPINLLGDDDDRCLYLALGMLSALRASIIAAWTDCRRCYRRREKCSDYRRRA